MGSAARSNAAAHKEGLPLWALLELQECLHKKFRCTEESEWPRDRHRVTPRARPLNRPQLTLQSTNSPGIASVNASFQAIPYPTFVILILPSSFIPITYLPMHTNAHTTPSSATHRL